MSLSAAGLLELTAELVDIPSVSHDEEKLADFVFGTLAEVDHLELTRLGDNIVARTTLDRPQRLVIAGHLDTVPPNGNHHAVVDAGRCSGIGAADMKGGLAVMLDLARSITEPVMDVTYLWYVCEEVAQRHSGLKQIEEVEPKFLVADAAILAEPTAACVEAGCQGVIRIEVCLGGVRAHTARSHMGVNAIHRLGPILERIVSFVPREPVIDACSYRESLQAVSVNGGVATNVVPDEAKLVVSYRYAPDRSEQEALGELNELLGTLIDPERDRVTLTESDLGAAPNLAHPLLAKLVAASAQPPKAKLGWTDVSFFNARGVPATNFGPGDPALAHSAGEWVGQDELEAVRDSLGELISSEA